ncbi:MAG: hypothetical protein WBE75_06205 [Candidatus Omnitrophota bacterium]
MVAGDILVYVFAGDDASGKSIHLNQLKETFLPADIRAFNYDVFYGNELVLQSFQERLLSIPVNSPRRMIVLKNAGALSAAARKFVSDYAAAAHKSVLLVVDFERFDPKDTFFSSLCGHGRLFRFSEEQHTDAFALAGLMRSGRAADALKALHKLIEGGEKPERILGGVRYSCRKWEAERSAAAFKEILRCDLEIKTGRLKPLFALERLIITLSRRFQSQIVKKMPPG